MKKFSLALVAVLAACFSFGQKTTAKAIHCAVNTKDEVDVKMATKNHKFADYNGRRYFFCCDSCPAAFKADPKKYAMNDSTAIPTKKKSKRKSHKI